MSGTGTCIGCGVGAFGWLCAICKGDALQTEEWRQRRDAFRHAEKPSSADLLASADRLLSPILRDGRPDTMALALVLAHLKAVLEDHERRLCAIEERPR